MSVLRLTPTHWMELADTLAFPVYSSLGSFKESSPPFSARHWLNQRDFAVPPRGGTVLAQTVWDGP